MKFKKRIIALAVIAALLALLTAWIVWSNTALEVNFTVVSSGDLPNSFSGFRIAQVSDLHNTEFGEGNETLLRLLDESAPDVILLTGDLVDSRRTDIGVGIAFAEQAVQIAPTYYVTGNHEARLLEYSELKAGLEAAGVIVLENERVELERSGESITLLGIDDPSFRTDYLLGDEETVVRSTLQDLTGEEEEFTLLLSHRPELFAVYADIGIDLVFSGHAHGGQFRLPFVGGLFAPGQGLFPKYDAGLYTSKETSMIVSRGIGNSILPFRINNPPEVVLVELQKTAK